MKKIEIRTSLEINNSFLNEYFLLADKMLPCEIEDLYISFINELFNYADYTNKLKETERLITNNSLSLIHVSTDISNIKDPNELAKYKKLSKDLRIKRAILMKNKSHYSKDIANVLDKMLNIMKEIHNGKSIYDLEEYTDDNIVVNYVNLRKRCYMIMEYISSFILKKELIDNKDHDLLNITIEALNLFDLEDILSNPLIINDINNALKLIISYLKDKTIDYKALNEIKSKLVDTKYSSIIDMLDKVYNKNIQYRFK